MVLASRLDDTTEAWPSVSSIADDAGLTARAVRAALRHLEAGGIITCIRPGGGQKKSSIYRVNIGAKPGTEFRVMPAATVLKPGSKRHRTRNQTTPNPELSSAEDSRRLHEAARARDVMPPAGAVAAHARPKVADADDPDGWWHREAARLAGDREALQHLLRSARGSDRPGVIGAITARLATCPPAPVAAQPEPMPAGQEDAA